MPAPGKSDVPDIKPLGDVPKAAAAPAPAGEAKNAPGEAPGLLSFKRGQQYYTGAGRKWADFLIGLLLPAVLWALTLPLGLLGSAPVILSSMLSLLLFAGYVAAIVLAFVFGRRFIGIGLLVAILIPIVLVLLLFGACLLSASNF